MCRREIKCIAHQRWTRIERAIHLELCQQFLSPARAKNVHRPIHIANVNPSAREQEASPDSSVGLVLPNVHAGYPVQTMQRSAQVTYV